MGAVKPSTEATAVKAWNTACAPSDIQLSFLIGVSGGVVLETSNGYIRLRDNIARSYDKGRGGIMYHPLKPDK